MISRWRINRAKRSMGDPSNGSRKSTILPKTYHHDNNKNSTSHNFLLGGMHHKSPNSRMHNRNHYRRNRHYQSRGSFILWGFLSSKNRKRISFAASSILFVYFYYYYHGYQDNQSTSTIVENNSNTIQNAGSSSTISTDFNKIDDQFLSSIQQTTRLNKDNLKPLDMIRQEENLLAQSWEQQQQQNHSMKRSKRLSITEKIVPKWFHRNDVILDPNQDSNNNNNNNSHTSDAQKVVDKNPTKQNSDQKINEQHENNNIEQNNNTHDQSLQSKSTNLIRTLHNMDQHALNSKCHTTISQSSNSNPTISLVMQTTLDRLPLITETCNRWIDSPIILVIYLSDKEEENLLVNDLQPIYTDSCPNLNIIPYLSSSTDEKDKYRERKLEYPINSLRNKGLDEVETSHVLVMDIDFIPSMDLEEIIKMTLSSSHSQENQHDMAIVVPAFERKVSPPCTTLEKCHEYLLNDPSFLPRSFGELENCMKLSHTIHNSNNNNKDKEEKNCIVFQSDNNWDGHSSTRSEDWFKGRWYDDDNKLEIGGSVADIAIDYNKPLRHIHCFDTLRYEPYVVIPWCPIGNNNQNPLSPYYDERFYGYGKNKIQQISHLRMKGYSFSVLPKGFIIHQPHPISMTKETWIRGKEFDLHRNMDKLYPVYLSELGNTYQSQRNLVTPQCKRQ